MIEYTGKDYIDYKLNTDFVRHYLSNVYWTYHEEPDRIDTFHYWIRCFCARVENEKNIA